VSNQPTTITSNDESFVDRFWNVFNWRHAFFILLLITVAVFADILFSSDGRILSAWGCDLYNGELSGLDFFYRELKQGHVVLWNPHVFSGTFTLSSVLYPPHFIHLLLPLPQAINTVIALHVFLTGFFMYLWTAHRRLHPLACLLSAVLLMFSCPFFLHVFAGHVGNIEAMTWAPLIFLSIDGVMDRPSLKWALLGIFAVAMQILIGQFQYVYYTALAVFVYCLLNFFPILRKKYAILCLLSIPVGSLLLSAFHFLPTIAATQEGVRSAGVSTAFASMFSFPLENLMTFFSPFSFGDMRATPYWGRWYLWEVCLFFGVSGFFLALYGTATSFKRGQHRLIAMVIILMILAFGAYTPVFNILFDWFPGFNKFRGTCKFIFFASLFLILLAGYGLDQLLRKEQGRASWLQVVIPLTAALLLSTTAILLFYAHSLPSINKLWVDLIQFVANTRESYLPADIYRNALFPVQAAKSTSQGLFVAAYLCLIIAVLFHMLRSSKKPVYILIFLAIFEVIIFARLNMQTFSYSDLMIDQFKAFYKTHLGDYRVMSLVNANTAMSTGAQDISGYGPAALGRYVQFIAFTQGADPDKATTYLNIHQYSPLFKMLRLRYVFSPSDKGIAVREFQDVMPRFSLIQDWKVAETRNEIFQEMAKKTFDPENTVVLEKTPFSPVPEDLKSDTKNTFAVLERASDHFTVKADLATRAVLLITDNYSKGWQVRTLSQNLQGQYRIMPANYTLMAIPLTAGKHHFRVYYRPVQFVIGAWISGISWIGYGGLLVFVFFRRYKKGVTQDS